MLFVTENGDTDELDMMSEMELSVIYSLKVNKVMGGLLGYVVAGDVTHGHVLHITSPNDTTHILLGDSLYQIYVHWNRGLSWQSQPFLQEINTPSIIEKEIYQMYTYKPSHKVKKNK